MTYTYPVGYGNGFGYGYGNYYGFDLGTITTATRRR